jgi:hypothetical protein
MVFFSRDADAIEGIHLLQVFIGNRGNIVEKEPETELAAENMFFTPDDFGYLPGFNRPGTIFTLFCIAHRSPPRMILSL